MKYVLPRSVRRLVSLFLGLASRRLALVFALAFVMVAASACIRIRIPGLSPAATAVSEQPPVEEVTETPPEVAPTATRAASPRTTATARPRATASAKATATPKPTGKATPAPISTPQALAPTAVPPAGLTREQIDQLQPALAITESHVSHIYSVSNGRLAARTSRGFEVIDADSLESIAITEFGDRLQKESYFYYALSVDARAGALYFPDGSLNVYDLQTGRQSASLKVGAVISRALADIALNEDGSEVIVANQTLQRYNAATGKPTGKKYPLPKGTQWIQFAEDGSRVVACQDDNVLIVVDTRTGKQVELEAAFGSNAVTNLQLSPDGKWATAADDTGHAVVWDATTGKLAHDLHPDNEVDVTIDPQGAWLAARTDEAIYIINLDTEEAESKIELDGAAMPYLPHFSPDGKTLYVPSANAIDSFAVPGGELIKSARRLPIWDTAFMTDGARAQRVAMWNADWGSPEVVIVDAAGGNVAARLMQPYPVRFVQPGKKGDVVAVQTQYGGIYAWRIGDQKQLLAVEPSEARQGLLCLSPDETRVAYLQDNTLVVQSLVNPDEMHSYDLGFEPLVAGYCDANGRLALADDETGWIMDLAGNELTTLDNSVGLLHGFTFAFSPDGRYLLGRTAQRLFVWDAGTGKVVQRVALKRGDEVREVAFAPDSSTAALEYGDGADLIGLATGDVTAFPMQEGRSFVLRFSPDGKYIVTAAQVDTSLTQSRNYRLGELAIWDAATLKPIRAIQGGGPLTALDIRADGMQIVTASPSGELVVWGPPAR